MTGIEGGPLPDPQHPSEAFLQDELDRDRRSERGLIVKTALMLLICVAIVAVRQAYFV